MNVEKGASDEREQGATYQGIISVPGRLVPSDGNE